MYVCIYICMYIYILIKTFIQKTLKKWWFEQIVLCNKYDHPMDACRSYFLFKEQLRLMFIRLKVL